MKKRKILFVRLGHFSFTNASLLTQITKSFPDHEVIDFDVKEAVKKNWLLVIAGLVVETWFYGFRILLDANRRHSQFFQNPFIFRRMSSIISKLYTPIRHEIDVVFQTQGLFDGALPGVPLIIYTDYTMNSIRFSDIIFPDDLIKLETELYLRADAIAVTASHVVETLVEKYNCDRKRLHVVYIGANIPSDFVDFSLERYQRQKICFVGIEWERKGGPDLLEAFHRIADVFPNAQLTIVGCSPAVSHPRIRTTGKVPPSDVREILKESSIFCLPSIVEPSSVAAIEASTYGLPVIGTRIGGFIDSVEDGVTGLLTPPRDPAAIAAALSILLADFAKAREMGMAGRARALGTFNWDAVGSKVARIIEDIRQGEHDHAME
jgi:glycosyltransferase involved in cell wall biosynthesis